MRALLLCASSEKIWMTIEAITFSKESQAVAVGFEIIFLQGVMERAKPQLPDGLEFRLLPVKVTGQRTRVAFNAAESNLLGLVAFLLDRILVHFCW